MAIYDDVLKGIDSLMTENTDKETMDKILALNGLAESASAEHEKTEAELKDTRKDYIALIKKSGFPLKQDEGEDEGPHEPKALDEIISGVVKSRKK